MLCRNNEFQYEDDDEGDEDAASSSFNVYSFFSGKGFGELIGLDPTLEDIPIGERGAIEVQTSARMAEAAFMTQVLLATWGACQNELESQERG